METVLIAGCGDVGTALGRLLADDGEEVIGLRRSPGGLPAPIRPLAADLRDPDGLRDALADLPGIDAVVIAVTADERREDAYRATYLEGSRGLLRTLADLGHRPRPVVFTSSTAVYGQRDGRWVDETSPTEPRTATGRVLLETERTVLQGPFPGMVVRLGGIYGPGRTRLLERVRAGEATCHEQPRYTNRIHRDDCAGALAHLLRRPDPDDVYVGVDNDPAPKREVLGWLAERLDAPPPTVLPGANPRGAGKRARNDRLRATGYDLRYPTFREGYEAVLAEGG